MKEQPLFDFPKVAVNKKIRLIETFGGIGSQAMALRDIGADFEHYSLVGFDKYAVASYNAIHGTDFQTTDVRDVHGEDLGIVEKDRYCYLLTYSFPCFTGDTIVLTNKGLKQIKDVGTDDYVLTHTNNYEKVLDSRKTGTKNIFKVKGMGIDEIKCTENHRFYVREMSRYFPYYENGKRGNCRRFSEPKWIECKDLTKNHYLGIAINQKEVIPEWNGITFNWTDGRKERHKNQLSKFMSNHSFWWIIGRYLGDGWIRSQGGIIICCSKGETHEILPHLRNCGFNYSISEERTVNKIHISIKELELFVEPFGRGAENKVIPDFVFNMPCDLLKSLIDGFIGADGYAKNNLYKLSSISRNLIYGMAQIVAKAFKTPYRIYKNKRKPTVVIEGRLCNQKDGYELVFKTRKKKQDKAFYENGYIWFPIQSVENTNTCEDVYDIEVQNAHSFTANGVIVHNCTDLSVAGKMQGMSKADWEEGNSTRSGLLWEVERILKELPKEQLPDVLLMENVPQVHAEQNKADFDSWCEFLHKKGYQNFCADLNAKDYGIPQNRVRCFMVSVLADDFVDFEFPDPVPLERCMGDLLEETVDERYYINSPKARELIDKLVADGTLEGKKKLLTTTDNRQSAALLSRYGSELERFTDIATCAGGGIQPKVIDSTIVAMRGRGERNEQTLEVNKSGSTNALTTVQKDNLVLERNMAESERQSRIKTKKMPNGNIRFFQDDERKSAISELQLQNPENEAQTITTAGNAKIYEKKPFAGLENARESQKEQEYRIRKLTPRECWRLMAFKDSDFEKAEKVVSSTQLYKQAGNSICRCVLMAIFLQLNIQGIKNWNDRTDEEKRRLIYAEE